MPRIIHQNINGRQDNMFEVSIADCLLALFMVLLAASFYTATSEVFDSESQQMMEKSLVCIK